MSNYESNINAFIATIGAGAIFKLADWESLSELINTLECNVESISDAIDNWIEVESRREISEIYKKKLNEILEKNPPIELGNHLGPGGTGTPTPQPTQPTQDPSMLTRLKNEVIEHKPKFRDSND